MDIVTPVTSPTPSAVADIHPLLQQSLFLKVYVMVRHVLDRQRMAQLREQHLRWIIGLERAGTILMSGPTSACGTEPTIDGLTVIRADSEAAARAIGLEDPYVGHGAMSFEIFAWTIVEGCIPLRLTISNSKFTLG